MREEWNLKKSYELEEYSRSVRGYFSNMKRIRNSIREDKKVYSLNDKQKKDMLIKLDSLIDNKSLNKSIEGYFKQDYHETTNLHEQHQVLYKYNYLLKECYGKSVYEFLDNVDIESKFKSLETNNKWHI